METEMANGNNPYLPAGMTLHDLTRGVMRGMYDRLELPIPLSLWDVEPIESFVYDDNGKKTFVAKIPKVNCAGTEASGPEDPPASPRIQSVKKKGGHDSRP
jgi:hypothetical protein